MNKIVTLLLFILTYTTNAQDTLLNIDLPVSGAVYVLNNGEAFSGLNPATTGANHTWDFSRLEVLSQFTDTALLTSETNPLLSFFFIDNVLNDNRSNLSFHGQNINLGFTGLTDVYNYYYNSTDEYRQPGFGAVINSVPVPIVFSPHDVLYKFPLKYNDVDSVSYEYEVDLTSTIGIYYHVSRKRKNKVDGWGTLQTPLGIFNVLRIKSTITEQDSTFVVALNLGTKSAPYTIKEYKWIGKDHGLPLVQINTDASNVITQILFQDSLRLTGIHELSAVISEPLIFPNPSSEILVVKYFLKEKVNVEIELFSNDGKKISSVINEHQSFGENICPINLRRYNLASGIYILKIHAGNSTITKSLQIIR